MTGTVSSRWYFPDWLSDTGVRACSLAARGLWMDILSIAAGGKGRDHGFLLIAGRVPTTEAIAKLVGATLEETEKCLDELEQNGVFSRDKRKAIYNRRMVRAEKNRRNGREGGNPNLLKSKEIPNPVNSALVDLPVPVPDPVPLFPSGKRVKPLKNILRTFPDDWAMSEKNSEHAKERGFSNSEIADMGAHFVDYHRAKGDKMMDWDAAWRTWVRHAVKFRDENRARNYHQPRGSPRSPHPPAKGDATAAAMDLLFGERNREPASYDDGKTIDGDFTTEAGNFDSNRGNVARA